VANASLRRSLTLWQVSLSGIGVILGAGAYGLIGPAAAQAGNALWLAFLLAGLTIAAVDAEVVVAATPVDLTRLIRIDKPVVRARYEFAETAAPGLGGCVDDWLARLRLRSR
jgi:hypothetical protein